MHCIKGEVWKEISTPKIEVGPVVRHPSSKCQINRLILRPICRQVSGLQVMFVNLFPERRDTKGM